MTKQFWINILNYLSPDAQTRFYDYLRNRHIISNNYVHETSEGIAQKIFLWEDNVWKLLYKEYSASYENIEDALQDFSPDNALSVINYLKNLPDNGEYLRDSFITKLINGEYTVDNEDEFSMISLCKVNCHNTHNAIYLTRLADLNDDILVPFSCKLNNKKRKKNQCVILRKDGPELSESLGFWKWNNQQIIDGKIISDFNSEYQENLSPIELFPITDDKSLNITGLVQILKDGFNLPKYICSPCLLTGPLNSDGEMDAILYRESDFNIVTDSKKTRLRASLKKNIYSVTAYKITSVDFIVCEDRKILNPIYLEDTFTPESILTMNSDSLIQEVITEQMSKPQYKDTIGLTDKEWNNCRKLFQRVCSPTLHEEIAKRMNCSVTEIKPKTDSFISRLSSKFNSKDIDSNIIARIAMNNKSLHSQCESIIKKNWEEEHEEMISSAKSELDQHNAQLNQIKSDIKSTEAEYQKIVSDTVKAKDKLDQLKKEIQKYETLGTDTIQSIRNKISSAQQDMAGFIAELSPFLSQQNMQNNSLCETNQSNCWTFELGAEYHDPNKIKKCNDWKDTFSLLQDNLLYAGIDPQWSNMLSAFLYSAYLNRFPLLLAGPNAEAIAQALSITVCGKKVDILTCCGELNKETVSSFTESKLAAVKNPFHSDWIPYIPQSNNSFSLWLHPFTEDLMIEPLSLYNYAYPVFTDCFIETQPSVENMNAGLAADTYTEFVSGPKFRAKMTQIKNLGISRLMFNRLEQVLSDAKNMGAIPNSDIEYMLGLLPLCVLSGKREALSECLANQTNMAKVIRSEFERYIEE